MDGTVRIAQVGNGQTPDGDQMYKADLSVVPGKDAEGILAMLGNDELVNSKYPKSRLWFSDLKVKGGIAVYQDMQRNLSLYKILTRRTTPIYPEEQPF